MYRLAGRLPAAVEEVEEVERVEYYALRSGAGRLPAPVYKAYAVYEVYSVISLINLITFINFLLQQEIYRPADIPGES